ncbi:adenine phosphoribosyltransferase [Sediminispirochaeta smaragdinae]|uniref:Adenine phosphoribosyltransferase n=1 Tax=Sediminispirochaeta smaragdinae (strain DSM 11293 / JCM 15392 / SEBR 4228) TaxID=573413 RepID=E1R1A4_SEDSS|nr:adenine phosphoribosyltransferase [Sediminispirochaeta smaragdinae]ADK80924.1 phosphoribosyltransferase [Sediminispirochaeta smaragdinae DSM 11293]
MSATYDFDAAIRRIPDFPKPGVLFYDITSLIGNAEAFGAVIDTMKHLYQGRRIDAIAAVEARGFLFATPLAYLLNLPTILIRKKGKLPGATVERSFSLEYGEDTIQIHRGDIPIGGNVLIVDDLIATGGTIRAAVDLLRESGACANELFSVIGLPFLGFRELLSDCSIETLVCYEGE